MVLVNKLSFKRIIVGLLAILIFFQPLAAFAEYEPIISEDTAKPENKPGLIEKHVAKMIMGVGNFLIDISKAQDVTILVFQRPELVAKNSNEMMGNVDSAYRDSMYFGIFPSGLFDGIDSFYNFFTSLLPIPMVILLAGGGLFLLFDIFRNNEVRSKAKEMLFGTVVAILLIRFSPILWGWIIDINYVLVDGIYTKLKSEGVLITRFTNTIWDSSQYSNLSTTQSIGVAIMLFAAIFMTFIINYQYMMRMIQLAMLIVLFPFVILSSIIPSRKSAMNTWFTAFTSNIFMQGGHAIALGLFFFSLTKASSMSFWLVMAMLFGLPAMADVVNRIVGAMTGEGGGGGMRTSASNMSGLAGMMAINKIAQTVSGGKSGRGGNLVNQMDTGKGNITNAKGLMGGASAGGGDLTSSSMENMKQGTGTAPLSSGRPIGSAVDQNGRDLRTGIHQNHPLAAHVNRSRVGRNAQGFSGAVRQAGAKTVPILQRGISAGGKGIAKGGVKLANSNLARTAVRSSAIIAAGATGAIVGTMVAGNPGAGALIGSQVGRPIGTAANHVRYRVAKGVETGGELIRGASDKALGRVDSAKHYTNERLGFTDNAQNYDQQEMVRMGEELIGGKTGQVVGGAVGAINRGIGKMSKNPETKAMMRKVDERKSLAEQVEQSRGFQAHAQTELKDAQLAHNHVNSQFGPNSEAGKAWASQKQQAFNQASQEYKQKPHDENVRMKYEKAKSELKQPHPEVQKSSKNVHQREAVYNQQAYQTRQLEKKRDNIYRIQKEAENMKSLQSNVRSSGQL